MSDSSHLDRKYFIDAHVYNCPFCNRRHVSYEGRAKECFDWTNTKRAWLYIVECDSCQKRSVHLSYNDLAISGCTRNSTWSYSFSRDEEIASLDDHFFYSVPTSFFTVDERVPRLLRDLLTEAEGCLKSNFLTGASACARKIIYELAILQNATGQNYDERIKSLKSIRPDIDETFFDTLLTIQQLTSDKVHEQSYDGWEANHLRVLLATLSEVLYEVYVVPAVRRAKRESILGLKQGLESTRPKHKGGAKPA